MERLDNKNYIPDGKGNISCTLTEWNTDTNTPKYARYPDNSKVIDGTMLEIRNDSTGEFDSTAKCYDGYWYQY